MDESLKNDETSIYIVYCELDLADTQVVPVNPVVLRRLEYVHQP